MRFIEPKISLDKSWKFTPQVLILIILGILAIVGILILIWQLIKVPPSPPLPPPPVVTPEGNLQIPEGPIYGMWGVITSINTITIDRGAIKMEEGIITLQSDLNTKYTFKVNDETRIRKYSMGSEENPPSLQEDHLSWKILRIDDRIYFESPEDLLKVYEPKIITSIELYVQ